MEENIKVSIILPVYNVEDYISECLDSLINQTLKDIEIICVNDGSPDNSDKIIAKYAQKDSRIVVINQENQGTGIARNNGIKAARGEYIMFCDPDDWYELNACELAYNMIKKNNNDMSFFGLNYYYEETGTIKKDNFRLKGFLYETNLNNIDLKDLTTMYLNSGECYNRIYNKNFLYKNHIEFPNSKILEDCVFTMKTVLNAKSVSVQFNALYNYRQRMNSGVSLGINYWEEIFENRDIILNDILNSPYKNEFLRPYIPWCVKSMLYWYDKYSANNPSIRKDFYNKMREHFIKLDNSYDCSSIKQYMKYKRFKKVIKESYAKQLTKDITKKIIKNTFELTNIKRPDKIHKQITLLGIKFKFKKSTNFEKSKKNYEKLLKNIKTKNKIKLKVLFLVNEIAKWKYQSLYDLMVKNDNFEPIIALTIADNQNKFSNEEKQNVLHSNYEYFNNLNIECVYAYDFEKNKQVDLKRFNPDVVFYQQPWGIAKTQNVQNVSKYALTCYVPYYVPNYGELSMDCKPFHKNLFRYYVLNEKWAEIYRDYMKNYAGSIIGLGHTILDRFHLKNYNKLPKNDYVIYAPHWSICHENNKNKEYYATFDLNGKEILEYAKAHPEINWAFKPHPTLKSTLYKIDEMSSDEIESYYAKWEEFAYCSYTDYIDLFLNSKAIITDCGSFLVEYFVTEKPIIHLISDKTAIEPLEPSKIIFDTFYKVHNLDELYSTLDDVILKNNDTKKDERLKILKEVNLLNNYAAENIINDLSSTILNRK